MSQIVGNPSAGIGGMQLGVGVNGPLVLLWGNGSPNSITDASVMQAAVGSLFLRLDGGASTTLYVRETTSATSGWAAK